MPGGGSPSLRDSATITLRLDTTQARRDLDAFMGSVRGATIGVGGMGERVVGAPAAGGGGGGGMGLGGLAGRAAGVAGALAAPFLGGALGVVHNGLSWLNAPAGHAYGTDHDEIENAAQTRTEQRTLQAIRGIKTTPEQAGQVYNAIGRQEAHVARLEKEHIDQLHGAFELDRSKILAGQSERHLEAISKAADGILRWLIDNTVAARVVGLGR